MVKPAGSPLWQAASPGAVSTSAPGQIASALPVTAPRDPILPMAQARADHSTDKTFLSPDLLILDDLGLHRLTQQQSIDLYKLVIARHRTASFVITSNRGVDEWLGLFDDSILGNSALDRLANASYQIVIEGQSYLERLSPHKVLLDRKEVVDPQTPQ